LPPKINWLVVSTPLKNIIQWEGLSHAYVDKWGSQTSIIRIIGMIIRMRIGNMMTLGG
jgi:hypothetical protein